MPADADVLLPVVSPPGFLAHERADADVMVEEAPERAGLSDTGEGLWAVIFAGGIGSRFWPLSSPRRPKQLLNLIGGRPLIAECIGRLAGVVAPERILVLTSADIATAIHSAIPEVPAANMLIEPRPLGTAASLAWGATEVHRRAGRNAMIAAIHADLSVDFPQLFREALRRTSAIAMRHHALVSIAVSATRPDPAFGYLRTGVPLDGESVSSHVPRWVGEFIEKPSVSRARVLVGEGALWHSGILMGEVRVILRELAEHAHEVSDGLEALADADLEGFATGVRSASLERALLERTQRLAVMPAEFGWDDVGTWASLRRALDLDDEGNGAVGRAYFVDATANIVHAERGAVVLFGISKLLVVSIGGLTFVTTLERAGDLRQMIAQLPERVRGGRV